MSNKEWEEIDNNAFNKIIENRRKRIRNGRRALPKNSKAQRMKSTFVFIMALVY
jgi:hypothetical protein